MTECPAQAENRKGYLARYEQMLAWSARGDKQSQCAKCGLWIWPSETKWCPDFSVIERQEAEDD